MEAASAGHVEVAKILLEYGAGINTHSNEVSFYSLQFYSFTVLQFTVNCKLNMEQGLTPIPMRLVFISFSFIKEN